MREPWPLVPLGELLTRNEEWIALDPEATYSEVTVRLWGKGVALRRTVTGAEIAATQRLVVRRNQFILSRIDARNGASGLVPDALDGAVVSNDFPVFSTNTTRLLPEFLSWLSKTKTFVEWCKAASEGTTNRVRLKEDRFLATKISLPPLPEQRRIVARIGALAERIAEAKRLREEAWSEARCLRSTISRQVVDGLIPRGTRPLGELVSVRGGGTPSKANPFFWNGQIPWISPKDMKSLDIYDATDHISDEAVASSTAQVLPTGAVLIVVRGMILSHTVPAAVLRVAAAINQDMKALIPLDGLLPEYLCQALWAWNDRLLSFVEKSTHDTRKLETPKLLGFDIPFPPVEEQRRVVAHLAAVQAKVEALRSLQAEGDRELDALLPSVLAQAFAGQL